MKLIQFEDKNPTQAELEIYEVVLVVADKFGVDLGTAEESEDFMIKLVEQYQGSLDGLSTWLEEQIPQHYVAIGERPKWIQSPEWPFYKGKPMVFAGQLNITGDNALKLFHDDTSLYVFLGEDAQSAVVIQYF